MTELVETQTLWKLIGKGAQRGKQGFITMGQDETAARARCEWCAAYRMNLDEWDAVEEPARG